MTTTRILRERENFTMSTPDFDSMSPEELMAWMESLARRQGADEGFTTNKVVDVPEVDPTTVTDTGPGYIPYGMDAEKWAQKQREEEERKAARRAQAPAQPTPPPVQVTPPPQPIPAPPPQAAPAPAPAPQASAQPDFDSMSPEELMAWMESLARRQGADEGFTSNVIMDVPEVDPATVTDTGPGYIPYGMDAEKWAQKQREEEERKAARRTQPATPAQSTPATQVVQPQEDPQFELPPLPNLIPDETTQATPVAADNPLAWLESLGSGNNELPPLDLSALGAPLENAAAIPSDDPMAWLESLSQAPSNIPALEQFALDFDLPPAAPPAQQTTAAPEPATPTMGDNPLEWLESLARRQGVDSEELTTNAALDVPLPEVAPASDGPGYTDYTFEAPAESDLDTLKFLDDMEGGDFDSDFDSDQLDSASAWLDALASGQNVDEPVKAPDTSDIMSQLAKNQVNPNDIENWMANLLEQGASRSDVPDYLAEEEDEIVQAQLPDWLIEQVGTPPTAQPPSTPTQAPLIDEIVEPPAVEMPDWLTEDIDENTNLDFESIFDDVEPALNIASSTTPRISTDEIEIDSTDPWVEAFEMERKQGLDDINRIPDWYAEKLGQSVESADFEEAAPAPMVTPAATGSLAAAQLPAESELPEGELQAMPSWLADIAAAPAPVPAVDAPVTAADFTPISQPVDGLPDWLTEPMVVEAVDLPDWISESGVNPDDIPDWLKETMDTEETPVAPVEQPAAVVQPVPVQTAPVVVVSSPPAPVSPAIVPAAAAAINVADALQAAREEFRAGNIEVALYNYEAVVRANTSLDAVVGDLGSALRDETHKKNPAVYRVLGDGLMRQGKLQEALDTYRKALNLL
jgi:tetratricopeptide (TPR) repeat protein